MNTNEMAVFSRCGICVEPLTKENVFKAYDTGLIQYKTMADLIKTGRELSLWK